MSVSVCQCVFVCVCVCLLPVFRLLGLAIRDFLPACQLAPTCLLRPSTVPSGLQDAERQWADGWTEGCTHTQTHIHWQRWDREELTRERTKRASSKFSYFVDCYFFVGLLALLRSLPPKRNSSAAVTHHCWWGALTRLLRPHGGRCFCCTPYHTPSHLHPLSNCLILTGMDRFLSFVNSKCIPVCVVLIVFSPLFSATYSYSSCWGDRFASFACFFCFPLVFL